MQLKMFDFVPSRALVVGVLLSIFAQKWKTHARTHITYTIRIHDDNTKSNLMDLTRENDEKYKTEWRTHESRQQGRRKKNVNFLATLFSSSFRCEMRTNDISLYDKWAPDRINEAKLPQSFESAVVKLDKYWVHVCVGEDACSVYLLEYGYEDWRYTVPYTMGDGYRITYRYNNL